MNVMNVSEETRTIAVTGQTVEAGGVVVVGAELGESLCEQTDVWRVAKSSASKSPAGEEV